MSDVTETKSETLIIPTFREATFGESLDYLLAHLQGPVEILVVDDSDEDGFAKLEADVRERLPRLARGITIAVHRGPRLGKGAAIRMGALAASGDFVYLMDADVPVLPEFIDVFRQKLAEGADIVIGVRDPHRYAGAPLRRVLALGLRALQTLVVFQHATFSDTQCGFKAFDGKVLRSLARLQFTKGGMYDLEYLYAATKRQLRIEQVPVVLRGEVRASRINLLRCVLIDPFEIFWFKGCGLFGYYGRDHAGPSTR